MSKDMKKDNLESKHNKNISDNPKYKNNADALQTEKVTKKSTVQNKPMFKANVAGATSLRMYDVIIASLSFVIALTFLNALLISHELYFAIFTPLVVAIIGVVAYLIARFIVQNNEEIIKEIALDLFVAAVVACTISFIFCDNLVLIDYETRMHITIIAFVIFIIFSIAQKLKWNKAKERCYYFYPDMIKCSKKETGKRDALHILHGIVNVDIDMPLGNHEHPVRNCFVTWLSAIFSFNSRPIWKDKCGYRTITISPTGHPDDDIVLVDVENPQEVIANIKKHYPSYTNETIGKTFHL